MIFFNLLPKSWLDELYRKSVNRQAHLDILEQRLCGKATLDELGKKHNITRERARQIEAKGFRKLKQIIETRETVYSRNKVYPADFLLKRLDKARELWLSINELLQPYLDVEAPLIFVDAVDMSARLRYGLKKSACTTLNEAFQKYLDDKTYFLKVGGLGHKTNSELLALFTVYFKAPE